jgi:hypothetical protein
MTDQVQDQDVELDEEIEEAHDPKNAEAQSLAANDKAEAAGKTATKRKGDKSNSERADTFTPGDPDKHQKGSMKAAPNGAPMKAESVEIDGDFSEDLNALVESEATLSDEFKAKTAVIFEAAVKSKLAEEINRLEAEYQQQLDEELTATKEDLVENVDSYLNYVVETWVEENKLAIQSGLRTEIAEGFMGKLKDLFTESYIEVPESKVDLVDELATANEELEEQFNDAVAKSMKLAEELEGYKREAIIREASRDLAETQVEKLKSLAESIDFESEESFTAKVETLKESYFSKKTKESIVEESDEGEAETAEISDSMAQYVQALRKTTK